MLIVTVYKMKQFFYNDTCICIYMALKGNKNSDRHTLSIIILVIWYVAVFPKPNS